MLGRRSRLRDGNPNSSSRRKLSPFLAVGHQLKSNQLVGVEGLANYSAPRFWPRCEGELVGSIHIQLAPSRSSFDPSKFSNSPAIHKGPAIYANADKVVSRVEKILRSKIPGLTEMIIQVEGSEERVFCDCMTGG